MTTVAKSTLADAMNRRNPEMFLELKMMDKNVLQQFIQESKTVLYE